MSNVNRRSFLKLSGLSVLPAFSSLIPFRGAAQTAARPDSMVYLINDGPMYLPDQFISKLQEINKGKAISRDFYGTGGSIDELTQKFATLTGKEAAIYMPTGTMANQLALSVLSGDRTKVFVQETSHIYRDEADAAQSVYGKRLIPLAKGETFFTLEELQQAIRYLGEGEVFKSGIGAVSIENPVRRADGRTVPIEEIRKISAYCRANGYRLHLDGARLHLATAFTGIPIREYASYFDTVYISLYKYLGAPGGAILSGDKEVIDRMQHLIKVHGGAVFMNWAGAAMALHHLEGLEDRLQQAIARSKELFAQLNTLPGLRITSLQHGTNIFHLQLDKAVDNKELSTILRDKHQIVLGQRREDGTIRLMVNETLLNQEPSTIATAFKEALRSAKK